VKVPYDSEGYAQGATAVEHRRAYCHCGFVRPYLDEVPAKLSPTFCWCGSGWYRRLWEGILGQPIKVEHIETLTVTLSEAKGLCVNERDSSLRSE